jgi:hypothetical protein
MSSVSRVYLIRVESPLAWVVCTHYLSRIPLPKSLWASDRVISADYGQRKQGHAPHHCHLFACTNLLGTNTTSFEKLLVPLVNTVSRGRSLPQFVLNHLWTNVGNWFCSNCTTHLTSVNYIILTDDCSTSTVHRPGDDPRKECEECGNARGINVRYYPTWKHSPLKDYW